MEPKFQTSFIPKKPLPTTGVSPLRTPTVKHGTSILMIVATTLFILSLVAAGGSYLYKQFLISQQVAYKQDLADREKQFNTNLITELKQANFQIDTAHQLLASHVAVSGIFDIIGKFTAQNVRFLNLNLVRDPTSNVLKMTMSGMGSNLSSVAFQSKVFSTLDLYHLNNVVRNPALTNPSLGATGAVSFSFAGDINPTALLYENVISGVVPGQATSTTTTGQ